MSTPAKLAVTLVLLLLLGGLGAADYYYSGSEYASVTQTSSTNEADDTTDVVTLPPTATGATQGDGQLGVAKSTGPDVAAVIREQGVTTEESSELTMLAQVVKTDSAPLATLAILKDGDRIGSATWIQSPSVKAVFIALKDALLPAFSPELKDLRDETLQEEGKPVRNILSFFDPSLSEERLLFVRVRERLFEFHIANGKEDAMNTIIQALTER